MSVFSFVVFTWSHETMLQFVQRWLFVEGTRAMWTCGVGHPACSSLSTSRRDTTSAGESFHDQRWWHLHTADGVLTSSLHHTHNRRLLHSCYAPHLEWENKRVHLGHLAVVSTASVHQFCRWSLPQFWSHTWAASWVLFCTGVRLKPEWTESATRRRPCGELLTLKSITHNLLSSQSEEFMSRSLARWIFSMVTIAPSKTDCLFKRVYFK